MPTYEYECTRCGLITEEFKPMSAPRRQRCPECRGKVERLISGGTGILFKGSGFYINDSRGTKRNESGASASSASQEGSQTSTETKASSTNKAHNTTKAKKNKS